MDKNEHLLAPVFNRSVRIEARDEELSGDAGAVLVREILERTGVLDRLVAQPELNSTPANEPD